MDFGEIMTQISANEKRRLEDLRAKAYMDHRLSEMMAFAFNDPAKMPKVEEAYPFVKDNLDQTNKISEEEPDWKKDQVIFMQQAQKIKDKGGGT